MNFFKQVSWVSLGASPYEFLGFGGFLGASVATRKTMIYGKVKDIIPVVLSCVAESNLPKHDK
jgi:hypothetical protein